MLPQASAIRLGVSMRARLEGAIWKMPFDKTTSIDSGCAKFEIS